MMHDPHLGAALCRAHNDWIREAWLDKDERLRASIVVNMARPEDAAAEIDRAGADRRFVQVIVPVQTEIPLGRSVHKPIFDALDRHRLPLGIRRPSVSTTPLPPRSTSTTTRASGTRWPKTGGAEAGEIIKFVKDNNLVFNGF